MYPPSGKTLDVYRLLYREGKPLGVNEVQRKAGLSSPSLAHYHLNKLVNAGWAKQKDGGYAVERVLYENMIRIKRSAIPLQTTFSVFFATMIMGLFVLFGPSNYLSPLFLFALATNLIALGIFIYQTMVTLRQYRI